ncbi:MAG TPA: hypothetical protein VMH34_02085 [Gammaproteobacteria bacterium]|nr:hypothetical protein [Gammaproteobacteria bacterium]
MRAKLRKKSSEIRQQLAQMAAGLLAVDGKLGFPQARLKAGQMMRHSPRDLPTFAEIEAALIAHQQLFGGEQHRGRQQVMRRAALEAMRLLAPYSPCLVGPVLAGTARPHSAISLHVFGDTLEELTGFLEERGIPHQLGERRYAGSDRMYITLSFLAGGQSIRLVLFPTGAQHRAAPVSPIDGRPVRRADIGAVRRLLGEQGASMTWNPDVHF